MRPALAVLVVLALLGGLWLFVHEQSAMVQDLAQAKADLKAARDANQSQARDLATLMADRAADDQRLAALEGQLQAIGDNQEATRKAFAQVIANATPADQKLLASKLPAAALQLLPRAASASRNNEVNPAVDP